MTRRELNLCRSLWASVGWLRRGLDAVQRDPRDVVDERGQAATAGRASGSAIRSGVNRDVASHAAQFTDVTVHFTMTTHAGGPLDLKRSVRRLLAADVAVAAAWPSERSVRVAPGVRKLSSSLLDAERLKGDLSDFRRGQTWRSFVRLVRRHPGLAGTGILRRRNSGRACTDLADDLSSLDKALDEGVEVVADIQKIAAVERELDARLFGGRSRDEDEFVRLTLRGSYHDILLPGTGDSVHVVFEPRLLLHASGIVQLTIAMPVDSGLTTSQLVQLARSDRDAIARSQMAEPLLKGLPEGQLRGKWIKEVDAGARLREIIFDEKVTMAESLERHLFVVGDAVGRSLPREWSVYASVFAAAGDCCDPAQWRVGHQEDLARVTTRYGTAGRVSHEKLIGRDFSLDPDSILISNLASTTRIQIRGEPPDPIEHLDTVLLVEHVLLQYFRLRVLEGAISDPRLHGARLQAEQREAIAVFTSMRQYEVRYGSARELAVHLLADLGGDQMRRTIESTLGLAAQANATREASMQARRSLVLAWVGTILAVLVAIPALAELLGLVSSAPDGSVLAVLLAPLAWMASFGAWGPWLIVITVLGVVFGFWLLKIMRRLIGKLWRSARRIGGRGSRLPPRHVLHVDLQDGTPTADPTCASSWNR